MDAAPPHQAPAQSGSLHRSPTQWRCLAHSAGDGPPVPHRWPAHDTLTHRPLTQRAPSTHRTWGAVHLLPTDTPRVTQRLQWQASPCRQTADADLPHRSPAPTTRRQMPETHAKPNPQLAAELQRALKPVRRAVRRGRRAPPRAAVGASAWTRSGAPTSATANTAAASRHAQERTDPAMGALNSGHHRQGSMCSRECVANDGNGGGEV